MSKFYSIFHLAVSGISSAVVLPFVMLVAVVMGVAGLVISLDKWKIRKGALTRFKSTDLSGYHDRSTMSRAVDIPC